MRTELLILVLSWVFWYCIGFHIGKIAERIEKDEKRPEPSVLTEVDT